MKNYIPLRLVGTQGLVKHAAICARFYWHGMSVDIENWVCVTLYSVCIDEHTNECMGEHSELIIK